MLGCGLGFVLELFGGHTFMWSTAELSHFTGNMRICLFCLQTWTLATGEVCGHSSQGGTGWNVGHRPLSAIFTPTSWFLECVALPVPLLLGNALVD